jgi:hypothetical protein
MNDWSRLAVDPKAMQKLEAENELHQYVVDQAAQEAPIGKM